MIAANQVGTCDTGFDSDDNILTVIDERSTVALERAPKRELAQRLVALIAERLTGSAGGN